MLAMAALLLKRIGSALMGEAADGVAADVQADAAADAVAAARIDLAAAYRILDRLNLNEGIDNHLTMMVPGESATTAAGEGKRGPACG
jgi:hypothetical protein